MISFSCASCGRSLRVSDDKAGRKGRCPQCGTILTVPSAPAANPPAAGKEATSLLHEAVRADLRRTGASAAAGVLCPSCRHPLPPAAVTCLHCGWQRASTGLAAAGGPTCPSCGQSLPPGGRVCVQCGVYVPSGRPVLTARAPDEDALVTRAEGIIRPISWLVGLGIYPIYSEAPGRAKPFVTWGIAILTILVSAWFWSYEWSSSPKMHSMKNLMLWSGNGRYSEGQLVALYEGTNWGDKDAFYRKARELHGTVPDDRLGAAAHEGLPPEQRCVGSYRHSQLLTHAFLHADLLHLAGNLVFLLILGSRVNAAVGNGGMLVLYPLLAAISGLAQAGSTASEPPMASLGASGAIMGLAGIYLVLFPLHRVHVAAWLRWGLVGGFRLSLKLFAAWGVLVVLFYIAFDVFYIVISADTGTAHWAHVGGLLAGMGVATVLLVVRLAHSNGDLLSLLLGKYAWPLIGTPHAHQRYERGFLGLLRRV